MKISLPGSKHKIGLIFAMVVSVLVLLPGGARAEAPKPANSEESSERIKDLEARVEALEEGQRTWVEELGRMIHFGAFGSTEYEKFEGSKNTFDNHRIQLLFGVTVFDRIRFNNEIEFEHVSNVVGAGGGKQDSGEIKVEQTYADFLIHPAINFMVGVFYVPFGYYNQHSYNILHNFTDRPLVMRRIFPSEYSDVGAQLHGDINIGDNFTLEYQVAVVNGLDNGFSSGRGGLRGARPIRAYDFNSDKSVVGRLGAQVYDQLMFGFSGYYGDYDASNNDAITALGADLRWWPQGLGWVDKFRLTSEFAYFKLDEGLASDGNPAPNMLWGVYVDVSYDFWFDILNKTFLGKNFDDPTFRIAYRYGIGRIDGTTSGNLQESRHSFGFNYRPCANFALKLQYEINQSGRGTGGFERQDADGFMASIAFAF